MTSLEVIDTDAFLEMPATSQLLYFHLNGRADDDGFVANPRKIMKIVSAGADDLKVLIGKKFVISFEDGICVIKHWRINNFIRKDIYKETRYLNLKKTLFIRSNGAYTQTGDERAIPIPKGHFQLEDVDVSLTKRQLRLGQDRLGQVRERGDTPSQIAKSFFEEGKYYNDIREEVGLKVPQPTLDEELKKFNLYWTEPNKSGTRVRWEQQPTFDVRRRLITWFSRIKGYQQSVNRGRGIA